MKRGKFLYETPTFFAILAIIISCAQHYSFKCYGIFEEFSSFQESIKELLLCIIGSLVSLLGLSVGGIAFLLALSKIDSEEQNDSLSRAMKLFQVYASLNVIGIIFFITIFIFMGGKNEIIFNQLSINLSLIPLFIFNYILFLSVTLIRVLIYVFRINKKRF